MSDLPTLRARVEAAQALAARATPGPWRFDNTPGCRQIKGGKRTDSARQVHYSRIAHTDGYYDDGVDHANAELMAAAPDLVTHLTDALALAESQAAQLALRKSELEGVACELSILETADPGWPEYTPPPDSVYDALPADDRGRGRPYESAAGRLADAVHARLAEMVRERDEARDELTAIRTALGDGADESAWSPGSTMAEAVAALRGERAAVVAFLRHEPVTVWTCDGHRHRNGETCSGLREMTVPEIADAIADGKHRPHAGALAGEDGR